ncbi:hypothetical protein MMC25_005539 [Agyrium rufum]|nr:hypothetical protein [Agyrium rufum]
MATSAGAAPTATTVPPRLRRFLPLNPEKLKAGSSAEAMEEDGALRLEGVIFDVDGTLCEPQNYMFGQMREAMGIPKSVDILEHIYSLPASEQEGAMSKIQAIERDAMKLQKPQPGLVELMTYLDKRGIRKGICTRNFDAPVAHLLTTFLPDQTFFPILTRAFRPPKPHPAPLLHIASEWNVPASSCIMVGDSIDDMASGFAAGAATVLLCHSHNEALRENAWTDLGVQRLDDLVGVLEDGFEGLAKEEMVVE